MRKLKAKAPRPRTRAQGSQDPSQVFCIIDNMTVDAKKGDWTEGRARLDEANCKSPTQSPTSLSFRVSLLKVDEEPKSADTFSCTKESREETTTAANAEWSPPRRIQRSAARAIPTPGAVRVSAGSRARRVLNSEPGDGGSNPSFRIERERRTEITVDSEVVLPATLVGDDEAESSWSEAKQFDISCIPKATEIDSSKLSSSSLLRRRAMMAVLVLTVVVLVVMVVSLMNRRDSNQPDRNYQTVSFAEFRDSFLLADSLQRATEDPHSPQAQALAWMEDDTQDVSVLAWRMSQRYALAVFYYSLGGDSWVNHSDWLSAIDECSWHSALQETTHTHGHESVCDNDGQYVSLVLANQNLTGTIPPEIGLLANLKMLELTENHVRGNIPTTVGSLEELSSLFLESNELTGTLPTELGPLPHLAEVLIGDNQLSGPIPSEFGRLSELQTLDVVRNRLTGTLPTEIGLWPVIEYCHFSSNFMTGTVPSEIYRLETLKELNLCSNRFTGTIPSEVALLKNLEGFSLSGNEKLRGPIPTEIGSLPFLNSLAIELTSITGTIPSEL
jgi:hypothetical protein